MILDRVLQKDILNCLAKYYPNSISGNQLSTKCIGGELNHVDVKDAMRLTANGIYLEEHGLITLTKGNSGGFVYPINSKINARGLDFLQDDGGLSAILNTVTVRFDAENIRQIMASGIMKSDASDEEKSSLVSKVRALPANAFDKITGKLLDKALENPALLIDTLGSFFS